MSKLCHFLFILLGSSWLGFPLSLAGNPVMSADPAAIGMPAQDNQRPRVQFNRPKNGETYPINSRVPYSLTISDPEDGESKYEEIPRNQVLLRVQFIPEEELLPTPRQTMAEDPAGLEKILGSNCLNCHAFKGKLIGPSFLEISKKYQSGELEMTLMASRIKKGSSGVWGPVAMPGHPELTDGEIADMLLWITKEGALDHTDYYTGTEGSFLLNMPVKNQGKGAFELRASYMDKGVSGEGRRKGEDRILIRLGKE